MIYRNWLGIIGVACILFVSCKPTEVDVPITYYSSFLLKDTTVMLSKVEMDPMQVNDLLLRAMALFMDYGLLRGLLLRRCSSIN